MSAQPTKVGVIGYGRSTKVFHLPLLRSLPKLYRVTHLLSRRSLELPDIQVVDHDAFFQSDIELVVITTENKTHFSYARDALLSGKNVVVEKPFTATLEEGEQLVKLAKEKGLILSIFQNRRWDADFLTLKSLIANDRLGKVVNIVSRFDRYRPNGKGGWRETDETSGGVLFDLGSHLIDQIVSMLGVPHAIHAIVLRQRQLPSVTTDDFFELQLRYPQTLVTLSAGMLVRSSSPRFVVHGTKGTWTKPGLDVQEGQLVDGLNPSSHPDTFGVESRENWGTIDTELDDGLHFVGSLEGPRGHYQGFYINVHEAMTKKDPSVLEVKPEQALLTMKILSKAKKASETNGVVNLE
ncbi:putative dehydrogenase [Planoprotostelium fungivorum]|uniref:Putative dehydrogenase n=1 Tax=Planoprotostelium fungivorum TaxID=1890364 RepID=A0A2P6NYY3_9EUKA|nr:putative dehydrogenase [Planoprotostelium fungivorum]